MKSTTLRKTIPFWFVLGISILLFYGCKKDEGLKITKLQNVKISFLHPNRINFVQGDTVNLEAVLLGDSIQDFSNLTIIWRSNIDGILKQVKGVRDLKLENTSLSVEEHQISIEIRNEVDSFKTGFLKINKSIKLLTPDKNDNSITLRWRKYNNANFTAYKVLRYYKNQLDTINVALQAGDTTFTEKSIELGADYRYSVIVTKTNGSLKSNDQVVVGGNFIETDYPIKKFLKDPLRDRVYAIIGTQSRYSNNSSGYGVIVINTRNLQVEKRLSQDNRLLDFTISLDGKYLYLSNESTTIQKIDLETLTVINPIQTKFGAYHISAGNNDRLFYHITPPTSGSTEFRIFDLANNKDLPYKDKMSAAQRNFYMGDFDIDPSDNTIYHVENLTFATLSKITTNSDIFELENSRSTFGFFGKPIFNIKKQNLFVKEKLYNKSLNVIGEFLNGNSEAYITAVSPSGNFAMSYRDMYDTNTFKKIFTLKGALESCIFLNDNQIIGCSTQNIISNEYKTRIFRYTLDN